jgi:hypothetical protein
VSRNIVQVGSGRSVNAYGILIDKCDDKIYFGDLATTLKWTEFNTER